MEKLLDDIFKKPIDEYELSKGGRQSVGKNVKASVEVMNTEDWLKSFKAKIDL